MHHPGGVAMRWSGVGRLQQPSSGRFQTRGDSCWTIQGLKRNMEIICYSRSGVRSEHSSCSDPWAVSSPTHGRSFGAHFDSCGQAPVEERLAVTRQILAEPITKPAAPLHPGQPST
jgi:hypothetical protein